LGYFTPEELAELRELRVRMQQLPTPDDLTEYRRLNRRFHQTIYTASRSGYLIRTLDQMWSTFPTMLLGNFSQTASQALPDYDSLELDEHDAVVAALENGDSDEAEECMRQHIEATHRKLLLTLGKDPASVGQTHMVT
jgi:DNA-binding GntR family transcriptional regulator